MKPNCYPVGRHSAKEHNELYEGTKKRLREFALELLFCNVAPGKRYELEDKMQHDERLQELVFYAVCDMLIQGTYVMQDAMLDELDNWREEIIKAMEEANE